MVFSRAFRNRSYFLGAHNPREFFPVELFARAIGDACVSKK